MKLAALFIKVLYSLCCLAPIKQRVAFLSRQSDGVSRDFSLIIDDLNAASIKSVVSSAAYKTSGLPAYITSTIMQVYLAATSAVIIVEGYVPAVSIPEKRDGICVIQTWHASGAIKKFGYAALGTAAGRRAKTAEVLRMHKNYDAIIAGGPGAVSAFSQAFGYPEDVIYPFGIARLDWLFALSKTSQPSSVARLLSSFGACADALGDSSFSSGRTPVVLYAPTLRADAPDHEWFLNAVSELSRECSACNISLIVTPHPLMDSPTISALEGQGVKFSGGLSTLELVPYVDAVITDYSAVALCAGFIKTPVYFYPFDIDSYRISPGLFVDPCSSFEMCASTDAKALAELISSDIECGFEKAATYLLWCESYFEGVLGGMCTRRVVELIKEALSGQKLTKSADKPQKNTTDNPGFQGRYIAKKEACA